MHNLFIINPNAGKRDFINRLVNEIEEYFSKHTNETYEIKICHEKNDATITAKQEAQKGKEVRIFACGGDGTTCNVLNGIAGYQNVQLGIIPKGTGNDFLKSFGDISSFYSVQKQMSGSVIKVDAIKAGEYYALNQASMGMDAAVCYHKSKIGNLPFVKGQGAYIISLLYSFLFSLNHTLTVQIGEESPVTDKYLFAIGANGKYCGGGFKSAPDALVSDGQLDCLTVKSVSRLKIISLLSKYSKGQHIKLPICNYKKAEKITVKANKPTFVNIDGEVIMAEEITFSVVPKFVNFILPGICTPRETEKSKSIRNGEKVLGLQMTK